MNRTTLLAALLLAPAALLAQDAGPKVGDMAPDFTLPAATMTGVSAKPVHLSELRGRTVVLAFFPKARTSGCTIQMKAYRDKYADLFGGGKDVTLLAISTDSAAALASWATDEKFPFTFVSDAGKSAGAAYATLLEGRPYENRVAFVIGKDGRIAKIFRPFREVDATSYTELGEAITASRAAKGK
ncbi:MAG: redoxin domain-containing protein [Gemmatimonadota bacterium]